MSGDRSQCRLIYDGYGASGTVQFVDDIFFGFLITEPLIVVVDGDPLSQGFVDLAAEYPVQVGFPAQDQGETVDGVKTVVHQHLDVLKDAVREVLCLVDGEKERLSLLVVEIPYLLLYRPEHGGLSSFVADTEDGTELLVEVGNTDGGQADVFHMVKVRVQVLCETAQAEGFSHARACGEETDAPGVLKEI